MKYKKKFLCNYFEALPVTGCGQIYIYNGLEDAQGFHLHDR